MQRFFLFLTIYYICRQLLTWGVACQTLDRKSARYLAGFDTQIIIWSCYLSLLGWVAWYSRMAIDSTSLFIGTAVLCGGTSLRVASLFSLRGSYFAMTWVRPQHIVIQRGPYRWLRHPLHLGLVVESLGLAIYGELSMIAVILTGVLAVEIARQNQREETLLAAALGTAYSSWSRCTWDYSDQPSIRTIADAWARVVAWISAGRTHDVIASTASTANLIRPTQS
jgi:protein-S-isoprenylcysteine O-methyltransferase Ste14